MEIKTKKHFNEIIKSLTEEILDEEELDEITSTEDVSGYNTPMAFGDKSSSSKRKNIKISTNSTGFKPVNEALSKEDVKKIKQLIRDVYANILRDMWIKRSVWKKSSSGNK